MTVVFDHVSAIGTRLNVPDASIFNLVARIVSERLPISVIVGIVSGLEMMPKWTLVMVKFPCGPRILNIHEEFMWRKKNWLDF